MESHKLSLIICTRNRPNLLKTLLSSIVKSPLQPHEIVIVSSGETILELINQYSAYFTIKHLHTELLGQSNQKTLAFKLVSTDSKWVFFLDDDLELMPNTLKNVYHRIELIQDNNVTGIGTQIINKSSNYQNLRQRKRNSGKQLGRVKPSGRASKYAFHKLTYTEWLNGASIWRRDCLSQYTLPILNSRYAAYEDVIFSSKVSSSSELVYDPKIQVMEQISHSRVKLNLSQFKYIVLWTGYLVCSRLDTKIMSYKFLTVYRAFSFLMNGGLVQVIKHHKFFSFSKFFAEIISLPMNKEKSKSIIVKLLELESNES